MVETTDVPLGDMKMKVRFLLLKCLPRPLASQSNECSLDFVLLLPIPEEAIVKGKKEGGEEKMEEGGDGKEEGTIFLF